MSYDDESSGGCLSGLLALILLPYILIFYGYALLALMAYLVLEWIGQNIGTIVLIALPVVIVVLFVKFGVIKATFDLIKRAMNKRLRTRKFNQCFVGGAGSAQNQRSEQEEQDEKNIQSQINQSAIFTPSSNLYCYWCTKKLGLLSFEFKGRYFCQSCYERIKNE